MNKRIIVKCSLCGGTGKGIEEGELCSRCMFHPGEQELKSWHIDRGLAIPDIIDTQTGYTRIVYSSERWAQFPDMFRGILTDAFIFHPEYNREVFTRYYIIRVEGVEIKRRALPTCVRWGVVHPDNGICLQIFEKKKDALQYRKKNASAYKVVKVNIMPQEETR